MNTSIGMCGMLMALLGWLVVIEQLVFAWF